MIRWLALATIAFLSSAGMAIARPADCLLIVNGKAFIDGTCEFTQGQGYFQIQTTGRLVYFAQVSPSGQGAADGYWNEEPGANHAHTNLGVLKRDGACWVNDTARVCAWKLGEVRSYTSFTSEPSVTMLPAPESWNSGYEITLTSEGFPVVDVEKGCARTHQSDRANIGQCIEREQADYDLSKIVWSNLSDHSKGICSDSAKKFKHYFYGNFSSCLTIYALNEKVRDTSINPPKFRY